MCFTCPYKQSRTALHCRTSSDGFLEASQAVIDCGQNELVLESVEIPQRLTPGICMPPGTLKPHSLTRITVSQTRGDINVVLDGSKHLLFEKNDTVDPHIVTEKVMSGLPTCKSSLENVHRPS
ncbi:hypothetical protein TNCV_696041 [Trichonephila clavipes]|nr:hypothetical protein TNCV_696041 [Trichonephila clavipes]